MPSLYRAAVAALSVTLLASCATQYSSEDPRLWSASPMVEANRFYTSGLSVEDYVNGKPTLHVDGVNIRFLCQGFIEAGDEIRAEECRRVFVEIARRPANKDYAKTYNFYGEDLNIAINQLLLEQGRFEEVKANLLPYMSREASFHSFDVEKFDNARLQATARRILAYAQLSTGGLTESMRKVISEAAESSNPIVAAINPRARAYYLAELQYTLGNYSSCYQKVARSSDPGTGLLSTIDFDGSASSIQRVWDVMYPRIQALCAYEAGLLEEAKLSYEELLKQEDVKFLRGTQRLAHFHLSQIALRQNRKEDAIRHLKTAIDALESERAAIDSEAGRLGYATNKSEIYAQLVDLLIEKDQAAEAFEYAERGKARALIDMLASKRSAGGESDRGTFSRALRAVDDVDATEVGMAVSGVAGTKRSISVRQSIARANPELGALISAQALPASDVQKRLGPDETLVEFYGEGDRLFAFVVTRQHTKAVRLDAKVVAKHARAFRRSMTDAASRDYQVQGKQLYDAALGSAMRYAGSGPLTIVPHAELHYVPFAALHDGSKYLIQRVDLRLLPSASVLPFLAGDAPPKGNGLLILGNPDLGNRELDLPGAEQEARMLKRINRTAHVLLRGQASETALRTAGPQFREIHFAMHGKFDSANAMSSGLYMARDAENDGVLSVAELYDLRLDVDMVVLSACETALGDTSKGDDVVGLNRGFLFAGARSIVSSLWEVDDNATRDLMVAFYQQRARYGKAGGLRQAQLATMEKYRHPYYWAAFQMSGLF